MAKSQKIYFKKCLKKLYYIMKYTVNIYVTGFTTNGRGFGCPRPTNTL